MGKHVDAFQENVVKLSSLALGSKNLGLSVLLGVGAILVAFLAVVAHSAAVDRAIEKAARDQGLKEHVEQVKRAVRDAAFMRGQVSDVKTEVGDFEKRARQVCVRMERSEGDWVNKVNELKERLGIFRAPWPFPISSEYRWPLPPRANACLWQVENRQLVQINLTNAYWISDVLRSLLRGAALSSPSHRAYDCCFLLDTTGSMDDPASNKLSEWYGFVRYLGSCSGAQWRELGAPAAALYGYTCFSDEDKKKGHRDPLWPIVSLTDDRDQFIAEAAAVKKRGGDKKKLAEPLCEGLHYAMGNCKWRSPFRLVVAITDGKNREIEQDELKDYGVDRGATYKTVVEDVAKHNVYCVIITVDVAKLFDRVDPQESW